MASKKDLQNAIDLIAAEDFPGSKLTIGEAWYNFLDEDAEWSAFEVQEISEDAYVEINDGDIIVQLEGKASDGQEVVIQYVVDEDNNWGLSYIGFGDNDLDAYEAEEFMHDLAKKLKKSGAEAYAGKGSSNKGSKSRNSIPSKPTKPAGKKRAEEPFKSDGRPDPSYAAWCAAMGYEVSEEYWEEYEEVWEIYEEEYEEYEEYDDDDDDEYDDDDDDDDDDWDDDDDDDWDDDDF